MAIQIFTLNRNGVFELKSKSSNQCKAKGHTLYEYTIRLRCSTKLDNQGFIIDHMIIHNSIVEAVGLKPTSCEKLCLLLAKVVKKAFLAHDKQSILYSSYVKIRPIPSSRVELGSANYAFMELETTY